MWQQLRGLGHRRCSGCLPTVLRSQQTARHHPEAICDKAATADIPAGTHKVACAAQRAAHVTGKRSNTGIGQSRCVRGVAVCAPLRTLQSGASAGKSIVRVQLAAVASVSSSELSGAWPATLTPLDLFCAVSPWAPVATVPLPWQPGGTGNKTLGRPSDSGWTARVSVYAAATSGCRAGEGGRGGSDTCGGVRAARCSTGGLIAVSTAPCGACGGCNTADSAAGSSGVGDGGGVGGSGAAD